MGRDIQQITDPNKPSQAVPLKRFAKFALMFNGEKCTPYLAAIAEAKNIQYAVVCPGSRSAPLALAFARQHGIECIPVVDERSAAYIALGIAQQTELPVILICTSGTAALNFSPAIAEAYHQKIPLLVLTADRPAEWIGQQDGQAIQQADVYRNFILRSYSVNGETYHPDDLWHSQRVMNEAIDVALENNGPVHINISFREPLYQLPELDQTKLRIIRSTVSDIHPVHSDPVLAATGLAAGHKKLCIVLGQMPYDEEQEYLLRKIETYSNVVIIKESLCNLELREAVLNANECLPAIPDDFVPDLVVSMGGGIISKKLKQFFRKHRVEHWHVAIDKTYTDTFQNLTRHIQCNNYTFLFSLGSALKKTAPASAYKNNWKTMSYRVQEKTNSYAREAVFSDFKAYHHIASCFPENYQLHLGNSMPVRYAQVFHYLHPETFSFSNRGTSGIDGVLSTAVGASYASDRPVIVILGDLSFQYDVNGLWNRLVSEELKVVVVNNAGGNIFRIIDGSSSVPELETYFETRMQQSFENICRHFGVQYFSASDEGALKTTWNSFLEHTGSPSLLEIKTDPVISEQVFKEFYQYLLH